MDRSVLKKIIIGIVIGVVIAAVVIVVPGFFKMKQAQGTQTGQYTWDDVESLEGTDMFLDSAISHIFDGDIEVNDDGSKVALGYHYDGISGSRGAIVEGTKKAPDENGVYEAKVTVDGYDKAGHGGYSTFYPENMSPQEVIDAINQAYWNRVFMYGNAYDGVSNSGLMIEMYLDDKDRIISAFPVMN